VEKNARRAKVGNRDPVFAFFYGFRLIVRDVARG
jgi:hypothetical protein